MKANKHHKEQKEQKPQPNQPDEADVASGANGAEDTSEKGSTENNTSNTTEARYNELMDRYQRTLAEFDNFRKRTTKEKSAMYDDGVRETIEKLLPIIDNFERALQYVEEKDKENKFYQGVAMIARQLGGFLTEIGVTPIAGCGEPFNHNVHYAVAHVEDEQYDANVVIEELQRGYSYKDKIIRPSMVKVAN